MQQACYMLYKLYNKHKVIVIKLLLVNYTAKLDLVRNQDWIGESMSI